MCLRIFNMLKRNSSGKQCSESQSGVSSDISSISTISNLSKLHAAHHFPVAPEDDHHIQSIIVVFTMGVIVSATLHRLSCSTTKLRMLDAPVPMLDSTCIHFVGDIVSSNYAQSQHTDNPTKFLGSAGNPAQRMYGWSA